MMKKVLCLTLSVLLCFGLSLTVFAIPQADPSDKFYDYAGLVASDDEICLCEELQRLTNRSGFDVAAVIMDDNEGYASYEYADDFYDYNGFSDDGVLLLINMDDREVYISTCGEAARYFTDGIIDQVTYELVEPLSNGDYGEAVMLFVMLSEEILQAPPKGESSSVTTTPPPIYDDTDRIDWLDLALSCLPIALIIGGIVVGVMALLHNRLPGKAQVTFHYVVGGNVQLTRIRDVFLTSNVSKTRIQEDSGTRSGGGSGRSSSHSTMHRSSSGRSHGGGGRKF